MSAREYQNQVYDLLTRAFSPALVKNEWDARHGALDRLTDKGIYAPRADIAVGHFNLDRENRAKNVQSIEQSARKNPFIRKLNTQGLILNRNPRCLLAIEIEFSGSMKHILGDIANASMLGYIGIVIGTAAGRRPNYPRIQRVRSYIETVVEFEKAPEGLFKNVLYFNTDEFLELLS